MNREYAKLKENDTIEFSPSDFRDEGIFNPLPETYFARGWKRYHDAIPEDPAGEGKHWEKDGYDDSGIQDIYVRWKAVADPVVPRKWTRLKMKTSLATAGFLAQVKALLGNIEVAPGYMALEAFTDCDYVEEFWPDVEKWNQLLDAAAQALGKTRGEVDAFLNAVPTDPGLTT